MNMRKTGVLMAALALAGGVQADEGKTREQAAQAVAMGLMKELGGALKKTMSAEGPAAAIRVCRDLAPRLTSRISREKGWRVTRVGTRVRNPLLGTPDAWEQQVLDRFAKRAAAGEPLGKLSFSAVVEEPNGRYFRYMKAIGVKPLCLTCHGSAEQIPAEVKAVLEAEYPHDRATGYRPGDLRGAFSIKWPLDAGG